MLKLKKLDPGGDTIIEVMFAIMVISFVLVGGFLATRTSLSAELAAQDRSSVVEVAQTQLDTVQSLYQNNLADSKTISTYLATDPNTNIPGVKYGSSFCVDNSAASGPSVVQYSSGNCTFESDGEYTSSPAIPYYTLTIKGDSSVSNQIDLNANWIDAQGNADTLTVDLRLLSPISINAAPLPACESGSDSRSSGSWSLSDDDIFASCTVTITVAGGAGGDGSDASGGRCSNGGSGSEIAFSISEPDLAADLDGSSMAINIGANGGNGASNYGGAGGGASSVAIGGFSASAGGGGGGGGGGGFDCDGTGENATQPGFTQTAGATNCYEELIDSEKSSICDGAHGGQTAGGAGGSCTGNFVGFGACDSGQSGGNGSTTRGGAGGAGGLVTYLPLVVLGRPPTSCVAGGGGGGGGSNTRAGGGGGGGLANNGIIFEPACWAGSGGGGGGGADSTSGTLNGAGSLSYGSNSGSGFVKISWE